MQHIKRILLFALTLSPVFLFADTYPEVLFDNSIVNGTYAKSKVKYSGDSWVENINKHLLVSDTLFFTPGNALSLKYLSAEESYWEATINYARQKYNYAVDDTDILSLRMFVQTPNTQSVDLPKICIRQRNYSADTLSLGDFISKLEYNKWIHVKIPVKKFRLNSKIASVLGITLIQNASSTHQHHIFIDQVEFLPLKYSELPLRSSAVLSEAVAYDKTVHLKWQLPLTPSIRYIKIYRSTNGEDFKAIGIRPIHMQSCLDITPQVGQKYYYKITWVDYNYNESPASSIKEVTTHELADTSIVKLVQMAHVNYFMENFDINSGMSIPFRMKNKVVVSTNETSGAILSLIVGVNNAYLTRQSALNRISKIVFFLMRSQHKNGIFPAYYDARKGIPEYNNQKDIYDVKATGTIIEALLIAREFFNLDNEAEKDLRTRINQLYQQVNWQAVTENNYLLKAKLSLLEESQTENNILFGLDKVINTYLLAIGSTKYPINSESYYEAVYNRYALYAKDTTQSINPYYLDELVTNVKVNPLDEVVKQDTLLAIPTFNTTKSYGVTLPFGTLNRSLLDLYQPFFTIRPQIINDSLINWNQALENYLAFVKRRDNEIGVGANNSDIWGFYKSRESDGNFRINPAISASSISVRKDVGTRAVINLYKQYGSMLFTEYGFRAWLDLRNDDVSDEYNAENQAAVAIAIENAKNGLIWNLYERIPELKAAREAIFKK